MKHSFATIALFLSLAPVACHNGSSAGNDTSGAHSATTATSGGSGTSPQDSGGGGTTSTGGGAVVLAAADMPFDVLTQHNDSARTGAMLTETALNPNSVSAATFGQLARLAVDGDVYAQPLYARNVAIGGGKHNVLFVATEHNSVYAFDTNQLTAPALWHVNLGPSMPMTDFPGESNFSTEIGITGTPAIDPNTGTMYLVVAEQTVDANDTKVFSHWVHALDITTGKDLPHSPVQLQATVPGDGAEEQGDTVSFDSSISLQRTSMLLYRGVLYFGASAHAYSPLYHGWFFGYDAATLAQKSVMNTTFNSAQGGIWMSGAGPAVDDDGYVYVTSGNGLNADPTAQHQESLLQFTADANGFVLHDWFTASNWQVMDANDLDFGSSGALQVPGTHISVSGDKSGNLYFLDTRHLEHIQPNDDQALSKLAMGSGTGFYGAPIYYVGVHGPRVYAWADNAKLQSYAVAEGVGPTAAADSAPTPADPSMPGGVLAVSADSQTPGSGIVWVSITTTGSASGTTRAGTLYAFAADDLSQVLYTSDQSGSRDTLGNLAKFCPPTVADGRVFMATQSNAVAVYGLLK